MPADRSPHKFDPLSHSDESIAGVKNINALPVVSHTDHETPVLDFDAYFNPGRTGMTSGIRQTFLNHPVGDIKGRRWHPSHRFGPHDGDLEIAEPARQQSHSVDEAHRRLAQLGDHRAQVTQHIASHPARTDYLIAAGSLDDVGRGLKAVSYTHLTLPTSDLV